MLQIKTILVPVDFSDFSHQALEYALDFAGHYGATVRLLHVIQVPVMAMPSIGAPAPAELQGELAESAEERLAALADRYADRGVPLGQRISHASPPPEAIVEEATRCAADLIVMATHGRTGLGRVLLGSVAEHVVRHAGCAVVTVRAKERTAQGKSAA